MQNFTTDFSLSVIDITIMVAYGILIILYGLWHAKRKSAEEYFLGGRSMTWPIVGISLFAANISSSTLIGLAGDAYKTDTHVYNYEWLAAVVLVFFAVFFMPFYLKSKIYTMPEFLEKRYDKRARYYFSFVTLIGNILVDTAAGLYVGMLVLRIIFPQIPTWLIIMMLAVAAAAYTIPGGLSSVVHTEVVQALLLIMGSILLTYFAFEHVGGWTGLISGLEAMKGQAPVGNQTPEEIFSLVRPLSDDFMPWTGLLFGAPILGFYFWANNQFMVQRVLGAKDLNHGRMGAIFAGFLKLPVILFMVFPGTVAILLFSDLDLTGLNYTVIREGKSVLCTSLNDCPNMTYPVLIFNLLPTGIIGLVLAGLLAAMMSSVSAVFNSASTLITMDFINNMRPGLSSKQLVRVGQITTLVLVFLAAAWTPQIDRVGSLFLYLQVVIAFTCPPVVGVFLLGIFWRRANADGAITGLLVGFFIAISLLTLQISEPQAGMLKIIADIHFLHKAVILLFACLLIQIVVTLATSSRQGKESQQLIWTKDFYIQETEELRGLPWYKNFRILSLFLLIVTAIVVGIFW